MSETWRERLSRRRLEIGIEGPEYDYIQSYIEFYCSEADRRCKEIDMNKTVDEVIDSMKNEDFDRFTRSVINSVHKKQGFDGQAPAQTAWSMNLYVEKWFIAYTAIPVPRRA